MNFKIRQYLKRLSIGLFISISIMSYLFSGLFRMNAIYTSMLYTVLYTSSFHFASIYFLSQADEKSSLLKQRVLFFLKLFLLLLLITAFGQWLTISSEFVGFNSFILFAEILIFCLIFPLIISFREIKKG